MNSIAPVIPKRNVFDLSHEFKFSGDMGKLYPCLVQEVLPGDTFVLNTDMLLRAAPLVTPPMHRVNVYTHYFFVPNRIIWNEWEPFITGGPQGTSAPVFPTYYESNMVVGSLQDFLGLPTGTTQNVNYSILPFRAYNKIYNDWYRDQTFQPELTINYGSGEDSTTTRQLQMRNWEKDYFTSALPWTQRGPQVTVSLGTTAPVTATTDVSLSIALDSDGANYLINPTLTDTVKLSYANDESGDEQVKAGLPASKINDMDLVADLSTSTAITINSLRNSFAIQRFFERSARGGARYAEMLLVHFGVKSSDARLQRPEYLGGGKSPLQFSEIPQTSQTGTTPQGNLAGHGYAAGRTHGFTKTFEEHGYIIGISSIMPRTSYQQGLPRHFMRRTKFDYFFPEFAHLGEQPIFNAEIYADTTAPTGVWGYIGRYDEYRRQESTVHGYFRTSLNNWHMSRIFDSAPELNSSFITADPTHRIFSAPTVDTLYCQLYHNIKAIRLLPVVGEPGLIDH